MKSLFDFLPTMFVYFVFHFVLGQPFGLSLVALPVIIVILTVMNLGLGLLFAPLMVFYRDTGGFLPYVTRIWLYVTPVLYFVQRDPAEAARVPAVESAVPVVRGARADLQRAVPVAGYLLARRGVGGRVLLRRCRRVPGARA